MQTQQLLAALLTRIQSGDILVSTLATFILWEEVSVESVWDMTNRICDRYLSPRSTESS